MAYSAPSVPDFKAYFFRDFPYGDDVEKNVLDADITKAFGQTNVNINQALFGSQESYTIGYLLLSAHYLVVDLRMSSQGISGRYSWLTQSKSVGSVSESFAIPQKILDSPYLAQLVSTNYGAKYVELVLPQLAGAIYSTPGMTQP